MLYIDLLLSFVVFVMGLLSLFLKRFKINRWVIVLSLLFLPVSVVNYYLPEIDVKVFGEITITNLILYPFVKILLVLALLRFIFRGENIR